MESKKKQNTFNKIISSGPTYGISDVSITRQLWSEIANEYKGTFKISNTAGNVLETHNITIPYNNWIIKISESDTKPLKFKISFKTKKHLKINLTWEDIFDKIKKTLGLKEVQIGWKDFDDKYFINTNQPEIIKLIIDSEIQEAMLKYNIFSISYSTNKKSQSSELASTIQKNFGDKKMIVDLIAMFEKIIDNLKKEEVID